MIIGNALIIEAVLNRFLCTPCAKILWRTVFLFCLSVVLNSTLFSCWAETNPVQASDQEKSLRVNASRALNSLGLFYYDKQEYEKAVSSLQDALKYDPSNEGIRTNLALGYLQQGKFDNVIETLSFASELQSDQRSVTALAVSYFALGKYAEAARYYEKLAQMVPDDVVLLLTWAVSCQLSGQHQQAQSVLERLPKEKVIQAQHHVILGDAHRSQLRLKQAIAEYGNALALASDLPDVNYRLGVLHSDLNAYDKAAEAFRRELAVNPRNAEANYSLGAYFVTTTDLEQSRRYFEKAIEFNQGHLGAYLGLMRIELAQKRPAAALEWAKKAEGIGRENEEFHYLKSRAFNLLGQPERAAKELQIFQELKARKK